MTLADLTLSRLAGWTQELMRSSRPADALGVVFKALKSVLEAEGAAAFIAAEGALAQAPVAGVVERLHAELFRQHLEEGILDWALKEGRACFLPSFDENAPGGVAVVPLWKGGLCAGLIWVPCQLRHESITPDVLDFLKILSGPASAALLD